MASVGLPRNARKAELAEGTCYSVAVGWEDFRDMETGTVTKIFIEASSPLGPRASRPLSSYPAAEVAPQFKPMEGTVLQ